MIENNNNNKDREVLPFEANLVSVRDFEEKKDLLIASSLERFGYLRVAKENKASFVFYLHEENDNKFDNWHKFTSYIFVDEKENIEVELNKKFYRELKNPYVWGVCTLNHVKIVFEAKVKGINKDELGIYSLGLETPKRMIRYQRRDSFRVKIPPFSKLRVDLDPNPKNPDFQSLPVVNLSIGGVAVLLNTNGNLSNMPTSFDNIVIHLEGQSFSNIKVRVCRVDVFNQGAIPLNIASKKTALNWYEVGLSFESLPYKVEQELFMIVNTMSKKIL